jgi:DNA-binding response OmpR family regulator/curved DNA-binding protein CbpA
MLKDLNDLADRDFMDKKLKILLVEDDKKFAESLQRILAEEGFECIIAEKPQTALSLTKVHNFDVALIDCMLPQMNGVELSLKIREMTGESTVLYLMSGIYKDKNFSVNAIKKTGAQSFLIKPFSSTDLIQMIRDSFKEVNDEISLKTKSIKGLFLQENLSQNLILSIINNNAVINGNELPFVLNSLFTYKCLGTLKISHSQLQLELNLHDFQISLDPPKIAPTRLKPHLLNGGWALNEDLDTLTQSDLSTSRLLELNLVSPHACAQIEKDTTFQTLSQFFVNDSINIKFTPSRVEPKKLRIEYAEFESNMYQWVLNADPNWLKAFYLPHMNIQLRKMNLSQNKTQFFPLVAANKAALSVMMKNQTIADFFAESQLNDETATQLLHLMLVFREFYLGDAQLEINYQSHKERLKKLQASLEHQNAFERLGLTDKSTELDIKKSYQEMSQSLHPDKLINAPQEVRTLSLLVYEKIQEAYNQIKNPEKRELYQKKMESLRKENLQKADLFFDKAITCLTRGDFSEAERILTDTQTLAPHSPRLKLLQCWQQIRNKQVPIAQITRTLQSLPQEEKESAIFLYVKGLSHIALNEVDKAMILFKNALAKEPNFMPARRDLASMTKDDKKPVNILNADLKDVVGLFFNRKK